MFRLQLQDLLYILFYSFYVLEFFFVLVELLQKDPFLHYKTRVNVYMVLGRGVVGSCFLLSTIVRILESGGVLVALVFGYGVRSCQLL